MLAMIKEMVQQKVAFQEAANLILQEDALNDSEVLGEGPTPEPTVDDEPINQNTDQQNASKEEPLPLPGNEDLPSPTEGNPEADSGGDLFQVTIDPRSNTMTSVLPVPPGSAGEAIGDDDFMNQRIDDGFSGQDNKSEPAPSPAEVGDILSMPISGTPSPEKPEAPTAEPTEDQSRAEPKEDGENKAAEGENGETITEAITLGDQPANDANGADNTDNGANSNGSDNEVTAAVKDKVNEMEAQDAPDAGMGDGLEDNNTETSDGQVDAGKEDVMKRLSTFTKNIEDLKMSVLKNLN